MPSLPPARKEPAVFNPLDYGAYFDKSSHPASGIYSSLAALQAVYPFALSLDDELDVLATQKAITLAQACITGGLVSLPAGRAICANSNTFNVARTGGASSALVTAGGAGYTSLPTAVGLPAGVTGTPIIEGAVLVAFVINTPGSGLTNGVYPCTFTGGGGSGATMDIRVSAYYTIELPPHSTKLPGQGTSSANSSPIYFIGQGYDITQFHYPVAPPYASARCIYAGRKWLGSAWSSDHRTFGNGLVGARYQAMYDMEVSDFSVFDNTFVEVALRPQVLQQTGAVLGVTPSDWMMLSNGSRMRLRNIQAAGGFAGFDVTGDQSVWFNVIANGGRFPIYFSKGSSNQTNRQLYGDHTWHHVKSINGTMGAIGVAVGGAMMSIHMHGCGLFQAPFGIYKESGTVSGTGELFITSCTFGDGFQFENLGNAMIYEEPTSGVLYNSIGGVTDFDTVEFAFGADNTYKYTGPLPSPYQAYNYGRWAHIVVGAHTGTVSYNRPNTSLIKFNNMDVAVNGTGVGYVPPNGYLPNTFTGSRSNTFPTFFYCSSWEGVEFEGILNELNSNLPATDSLVYNLANGGSVAGQSPGYFITPWTGQTNLGKVHLKSESWEGRMMQCMQTDGVSLTNWMALEDAGVSNGCKFTKVGTNKTNRKVAGILQQFGVFQSTPVMVAERADMMTTLTTETAPKASAAFGASLSAGVLALSRAGIGKGPGYGYVPGSPPAILLSGVSANNLTFTPNYDDYGGIPDFAINGTNSSLTGTPVLNINGGVTAPYAGWLIKAADGKAKHAPAAYAIPTITGGVLSIEVIYGGVEYRGTESATLVGLTTGSVTLTPVFTGGAVTSFTINGTNSGLAASGTLSIVMDWPDVPREQIVGEIVGSNTTTQSFAKIRL